MGRVRRASSAGSDAPPPPWWKVDGLEISLETLETGPLPEGNRPGDIQKLHDLIRGLARENRLLRERLAEELKRRYGSSSEKRKGKKKGAESEPGGSERGSSAGEEGPSSTGPDEGDEKSADDEPAPSGEKSGHGRRPIPPDLPREEVLLPLGEESCRRCRGPIHRLERVESYRYDYVPGRIRVKVLVRWRCVCDDPSCDGPFLIAPLPPEPIPKGRATAGLLAHLFVAKFADHCPIYRFRKILLRQKVNLPLSTLVDYVRKTADLLKPLWELFRTQVLSSAIIRTDDTHVRVRLPRKKGVLKGHLWAYKGDDEHPYVVFDFTPHWRGEAPQAFLKKFKGYIQADAYKGYDALFTDVTRIEVGCWAHARRKWVKAEKSSPRIAGEALDFIGKLYAIEDECKDSTPAERLRVRQEKSRPIFEEFGAWIANQQPRVLPKSAVGEAIEYAQNQWVALSRFLEDGRLKIDNNDVEQELRAVALGRKNWLATGSEIGGETAAIGYTMISSAIACGVDPVEWMTDVLEKIVTYPPDRLVDLLPDRWKAARDEQPSAHLVQDSAEPASLKDDEQPLESTPGLAPHATSQPPSKSGETRGSPPPAAGPADQKAPAQGPMVPSPTEEARGAARDSP